MLIFTLPCINSPYSLVFEHLDQDSIVEWNWDSAQLLRPFKLRDNIITVKVNYHHFKLQYQYTMAPP